MTKPNILDPRFKYTPSSKTDITKTFARVKREIRGGQDKLKPLVPYGGQSLIKPLVEPSLPQNGFVLSAQWFEME